jgi:hypothetical protein
VAKISTEIVDGWPVMAPLGQKETLLLGQHLTAGETVLGQVIGSFGQAVIATNQKLLVVKTGLMSGQIFGGKATGFDFRTIVGIEVRTGLVQGEFEILAGGLMNSQASNLSAKVNMAEQPNGVVFGKSDAAAFNAMAGKVRESSSAAHVLSAPAAASVSVADELAKFAALRDQGVLTEEEFQIRKASLLA